MTKTPCRDAFLSAQAARRTAPLQSGVYKLREAQGTIQRFEDTLRTIAAYSRKPQIFPLRHCSLGPLMTDEIEDYLRALPIKIIDIVAYDILPAITALTGDGIAESDVAYEIKTAHVNASHILRTCEALHRKLKTATLNSHSKVQTNLPEIYALLTDAYGIAERALQLVKWCAAQRKPREPENAFLSWD